MWNRINLFYNRQGREIQRVGLNRNAAERLSVLDFLPTFLSRKK